MRGEGRTSHANCAAHVHACMHACAHERSGGARENAAVNMNTDIEMNPNLETAAGVVREFWRLMGTNDFHAVAAVLADGFVLEWPQSNERIRGARNFALLNGEYPAHGPWTFTIGRVIGDACEAVSDVSVTDGVQRARAISFFTVANRKIARIVEFWPEPYAAPYDRSHLVERIE